MPQFEFKINEDGSIARILRGNLPHAQSVTLEQVYSVVTIYFRLAETNLMQLSGQTSNEKKRSFGLQSFLMSLTGLEAFTNTYFHLRGDQLKNNEILRRIEKRSGPLSEKFRDLVALTNDGPLSFEDNLIARIQELSQLRNEIVHPRWVPSSLVMNGLAPTEINGLVESPHAIFEEAQFCCEALMWCLLAVARVGQSRETGDVSGFLFHWTGIFGLTLPMIEKKLGL